MRCTHAHSPTLSHACTRAPAPALVLSPDFPCCVDPSQLVGKFCLRTTTVGEGGLRLGRIVGHTRLATVPDGQGDMFTVRYGCAARYSAYTAARG